jgi:hypothetical protein
MSIINNAERYRIIAYDTEREPLVKLYNSVVGVEDYVTQYKECWYLGIDSIHSIHFVYRYIPEQILTTIQTGPTFLLLCMEWESHVNVIQPIYEKIVVNLNIPPEKIILVAGSHGIYEEVIKVANDFSKNQIKFVSFSSTERAMFYEQPKIKNSVQRIFKRKFGNTKKKFLNFNRRWRLHRPMIVALLQSSNLLQHGYVSLAPSDDNLNWLDVWDGIVKPTIHYNCDETAILLSSNKESIMNIPPLYLDENDLTINYFEIRSSTIKYYDESYFSLVTETNYFDGPIFLTEKIFKPVVHQHPFILVSVHKSLEYFKSLGYKTFSPFFNEDYDLEENPCKRMIMIVNEVERLCNLSDEEWKNMLVEINKICYYNFTHLKNKKNIEDYITFHN